MIIFSHFFWKYAVLSEVARQRVDGLERELLQGSDRRINRAWEEEAKNLPTALAFPVPELTTPNSTESLSKHNTDHLRHVHVLRIIGIDPNKKRFNSQSHCHGMHG